MKKALIATLAVMTVFALTMVSCGGGGGGNEGHYTVTFDSQGGSAVSPATVSNSGTATVSKPTPNPTKENWDFAYWYKDLTEPQTQYDWNDPVKGNFTLYAKWNKKATGVDYVSVYFFTYGGSAIPTQDLVKNEKATKPADPTKAYYEFKGWYSDYSFTTEYDFNATVTDDLTLHAKWEFKGGDGITEITVTFVVGDDSEEIKIASGQKVTKPVPPPIDGFDLEGWYEDDAFTTPFDFDKALTANTTIYAKLVTSSYTVTFNSNGGSDVASAQAKSGEKISAPTPPTRDGYTFAGWFKDNNKFDVPWNFAVDTVIASVTIHARWTFIPTYVVPTYPPAEADDIVEEIGLSNGWSAIFQFVLPEGKVWEDYKELTVEHKLAVATTPVRARVWGNFVPYEVQNARFTSYNGKNIAVVGSWPGGSSGRWIWDNTYPGVTSAKEMFTSAVPTPADDTWFKVKYTIDGTKAHSAWNGHDNNAANALDGREPKAADKGPFYIGVGFSNASNTDPAVVSQIKNVTLVGYDNTIPDIVGMPLYFKSDKGDLYRAYNGQLDDDGNLQGGKPYWDIKSGSDKITAAAIPGLAPAPPETVTVTFNANYEGAPAATTKIILKGGKLEATDLVSPGDREGFVFLGWYDAATDGTKAAADDTYDDDATLYAHWQGFVVPPKVTIDDNAKLTALVTPAWGAKKDDDGYIIMADKTYNKTNGNSEADSLINIAFPSGDDALVAGYNTMTITYSYKEVQAPTSVPADWTVDAAGIAKQYNTSTSSGNAFTSSYFSFNQSGGTVTFDMTKMTGAGQSIQINAGDDNNNKQKRDGLVYGIKITKIEFVYRIQTIVSGDGLATLVEPAWGAKKDDDGFIIMADKTYNKTNGNSEADSLINIAFPANLDAAYNKLIVTYSYKEVQAPASVPADWTVDAAGIAKQYNTSTSSGNAFATSYFSFNQSGGTVMFDMTKMTGAGQSIQINAGDDNNNKQKRDGLVYGIKITKLEFFFEGQ